MKYHLLFLLLLAICISSCNKEITAKTWTLTGYTNIAGQINCTYTPGDITWKFTDDNLIIDGRLISPWSFTPCYITDEEDYNEEFEYSIEKSDGDEVLTVEGLGLEAIITTDEELIIEVISSEEFTPPWEGVKVHFEKY